jgi:hypothetical protein
MRPVGRVGLLLLLACAPATVHGQASQPPTDLARREPSPWVAAADTSGPNWLPPVSSLLIPGSGQLILGQERGAIYLVLEAFLLTRFFAFHSEGHREGDRFRELALTVARAPFAPAVPDTAFEYYEKVGDFIESGPYDTDAGPDLVPPDDERTFNGSQWALARRTFFPDPDNPPPTDSPEYQRALDFYRSRAVGPNFLWTWRNAGLEQDLFRQSIRQSDEAFRRATTQLGLLLANHLLSAVDAFISTRLGGVQRRVALESSVRRGAAAGDLDWVAGVRVRF